MEIEFIGPEKIKAGAVAGTQLIHEKIQEGVRLAITGDNAGKDISFEERLQYLIAVARTALGAEQSKWFEEIINGENYRNCTAVLTNNFWSLLPMASVRGWGDNIGRCKGKSPEQTPDKTWEDFNHDIVRIAYEVLKEFNNPLEFISFEEICEGIYDEKGWHRNQKNLFYRFFGDSSSILQYWKPNMYECVLFIILCNAMNKGYHYGDLVG